MDLSDVDPKVAGILRKHYQYTYGDALTWENVESLRLEGDLHLGEQTFGYVAYMKKPDLLKVVIFLDNGGRLTFGYDGMEAWQQNTLQSSSEAVLMPEAEALNFIRDSAMGGHLLYPQLKGKQFEFVGTTSIEGDRVYELKTTLPDGQVIRSFFDMTSFAELYQITVNNVNGLEELNVQADFRKVEGLRIPFSTTLNVNGEQVHQLRTNELQVNTGVMPWVFSRSDSSNLPKTPDADDVKNSSMNSATTSSFSMEAVDIWSTATGVVGSAFEIESAHAGEDSQDSNKGESKQEPEELEK